VVNAVEHRFNTTALRIISALIVFWLQAAALQYASGTWSSEVGGEPDEPAHYVTALMVQAFLLSGSYADPLAFASDYYLHYPKVALGHWPPLQYGLLGLWLTLFGATRVAALAFIALAAAGSATTVYLVARDKTGPIAGWLAGALFLALPLVQASSGMVMLESLVTLLTLLSTLAFARFVSTGRTSDALVFAFLAAAAILTRGSAWSLGLLPPLALLLSRRLDLLRSPALWLSVLPVAFLCVPWYVATHGMTKGAFFADSFDPDFTLAALQQFTGFIASSLGFALGIPFTVGLWVKVLRPQIRATEPVDPVWAALAAIIVVTILFHSLVPASIVPRYMVPVMPAAVLFSIAGADALAHRLSQSSERLSLTRLIVFSLVLAGFGVESLHIPALTNDGYRASLAAVVPAEGDENQVVLISSGPLGEGSIVAAAAEAAAEVGEDQFLILRGSKMLVDEDWLMRNWTSRVSTTEEIDAMLERIPVNAVIIDTIWHEFQKRPYHTLLREALENAPARWKKVGTYPLRRGGQLFPKALQVYVSSGGPRSPRQHPIDTDFIRSVTGR
jgi:hypothetical protein